MEWAIDVEELARFFCGTMLSGYVLALETKFWHLYISKITENSKPLTWVWVVYMVFATEHYYLLGKCVKLIILTSRLLVIFLFPNNGVTGAISVDMK